MKSYWLRPDSGRTVTELRDTPAPEPGPGQILVRMRAAGLNRGELIVGHSVKAGGAAKAAGAEGAGEIAKLGAGVTGFKTGERVMGRCAGSFAEYSLMDAREAIAALKTAKALGARVIGTSGSAEKLEKLKAMGLDAGIRTRSGDFAEGVMKATGGKGANLVVNNVGGSVFAETIRALAY